MAVRPHRGVYVLLDEDRYLVIQHDTLSRLPTVIALPTSRHQLAHRPPLGIFDPDHDLWIHTFAPATLWGDDVTVTDEVASDEVMIGVDAGIAAAIDVAVIG